MKGLLTRSLAASALLFLLTVSAQAIDPDLARFLATKKAQIHELADAQTNKVPVLVGKLFDAISVDDYETATNLANRLSLSSGRYSDSKYDAMSPMLRGAIWPAISEIIGANDVFHEWNNKWLHRFGREIISSIPRGSIYFGGTDPGRYIISALVDSHQAGDPFFVLTQNQLADEAYLDYLQAMYGKKIRIPSAPEFANLCSNYFTEATERYNAGKLKPGEEVSVIGGKIQIAGRTAVMTINGLLANLIIEKNPERKFYLEESFAIDAMYPYLSPHGLIFEVHHSPMKALSDDEIRNDQAYWKKLVAELIGDWVNEKTDVKVVCDFVDQCYLRKDLKDFKGDPAFISNIETRKSFGKLRSSIGELYAWRAEQAGTDKAEMQRNADIAFKQAFACGPPPEAIYYYSKFLAKINRTDDAIIVVKTALRLDPNIDVFNSLLRGLQKTQ